MERDGRERPGEQARVQRRRVWKRLWVGVAAGLLGYGAIAYLLVPYLYSNYARRHSSLENLPRITQTGDGHPGGPLNVALIGSEAEVKRIMVAARWYPADPLTLRSCLEIAEATVLKHPYEAAPVSSLYLKGRKEDLAFEQPVGANPRKRHHVRFWRTEKTDSDGRPLWVGAATFDTHVGFSHATGQVTHHIDGNVDTERDHVLETLRRTGNLAETYREESFHRALAGRNGGDDPWHTDGALLVGVIRRESNGSAGQQEKQGRRDWEKHDGQNLFSK